MAGPPLPSPLKRVNTAGLRPKTKIEVEWERWGTQGDLFTNSENDPSRYYAEFFCLTPNQQIQRKVVAALTNDDLLGKFKHNVSQLFINAIKILKSAQQDDIRRDHVVETLTILLKDVLNRDYDHYGTDVADILVGDPELVDQVFTDFVSSLDLIIHDSDSSASLRHSTLQLALLVVASLGHSAPNAYFLRRDLFSSLVSFISDPKTQQFAFEASLLIGLLANYRKGEVQNPYRVRIGDFVEEGVMTRVIELVQTVLIRSRDAYLAISDDAPPSIVTSLTSLVFNLKLSNLLVNPFAWSLPPPTSLTATNAPTKEADQSKKVDLKGKHRATEEEIAKGNDIWTATPTPNVSTPGSTLTIDPNDDNGTEVGPPTTPKRASPSSRSPSTPSRRPLLRHKTSSIYSTTSNGGPQGWIKTSDPFSKLPPTMIAILLPFHELATSNKTFGSLLFASVDGAPPLLPPALISLSSYILSHASTSHRAQLYSRLTLALLMLLVEEGEGKLTTPVEEPVRLCRQRHPALSTTISGQRPLVSSMIDCIVLFLRHNLKKRLDVESFSIALRLLQRILQQLKAEHVRLEYDWVVVWRSILTLSSFVVNHIKELRNQSDKVDDLISQIFITTSYACYWGEQLLAPSAQAQLYYELLHSDSVLASLSDLLGISSVTQPCDSTSSPPRLKGVAPLSPLPRFYFFGTSPTKSTFGSPTPSIHARSNSLPNGTGAGFVATECISNIRSSLSYFHSLISKHALVEQDASGDPLEPQEILRIIERNLAGVELIESAAMGDLRRFGGSSDVRGFDEFQRDLFEVVREDTKQLLESDFATK